MVHLKGGNDVMAGGGGGGNEGGKGADRVQDVMLCPSNKFFVYGTSKTMAEMIFLCIGQAKSCCVPSNKFFVYGTSKTMVEMIFCVSGKENHVVSRVTNFCVLDK